MELENKKSIVPLDIHLKIANFKFKITLDFMLEIANIAIKSNSYKDARNLIKKIYGQEISCERIRNVTNLIGEIVYSYDCKKANEAIDLHNAKKIKFTNEIDEVYYLEMDGSYINTRVKNDTNSSWSENKLCIAFNSKNLQKYRDKDGEIQYRIKKAEYISTFGSVEEFKKHVLAQAIRDNYNNYKYMAIISDGATWIRKLREEFFPFAQQILDIYHLFENTSTFLNTVYDDKTKINNLKEEWFELLEEGEWMKVLKDLEKFKDTKMPPGVVNLYNYIMNNSDMIDYPTYRQKYLFIGSGAIESGNKYVVKQRLCLGGMRWLREKAQLVLSLRCKEYSNLWDLVVILCKLYFKILELNNSNE